jgi:hypothetical protein
MFGVGLVIVGAELSSKMEKMQAKLHLVCICIVCSRGDVDV